METMATRTILEKPWLIMATERKHQRFSISVAVEVECKAWGRPVELRTKDISATGAFIESAVGPGYFVAYPHSVPGEILVDYLRVPPERPEHWPEILPNSARLSKVVYDGMQDVLRGVSRHVTIGRATKGGKPMSSWFVLCRDSNS